MPETKCAAKPCGEGKKKEKGTGNEFFHIIAKRFLGF